MKENQTSGRKLDHIRICLNKKVQSNLKTTGFEDVHLLHKALPEISLQEVDTSTTIFNHRLNSPIIIAGMTGGAASTARVNAALAEAAEELGVGMGVGSQRAAVENPKQAFSFQVARLKAPGAFIIANIGCPQLVGGYGMREVLQAVGMVKADALAVHLNPLHEAVQVEGQTDFRGVLKKIGEICRNVNVPVIAKETGAGISAETARMLEDAGVKGIDVGGAGGTSWAAVEYYRAEKAGNELNRRLGLTFWDWGIPTAASLVEVRKSTGLPVIATGGIRTGLDVAKAIALGADCVGVALPLLKPALEGPRSVVKELSYMIAELKTAAFLAGAKSLTELRKVPVVITGKTAEWLRSRGLLP